MSVDPSDRPPLFDTERESMHSPSSGYPFSPKVKAAAEPIVQQLAIKGLKALGRKMLGWFKHTPPRIDVTDMRPAPPVVGGVAILERKPAKRRPRVECPLCGRDVAVTDDGLTFYHRTDPGTRNTNYHTVRIADGVEVYGPK